MNFPEWIYLKKIKETEIYMFPRWGFTICSLDNKKEYLSLNPATKSLDHEYFYVKKIKDGIAYGNMHFKELPQDFGIPISELERRDKIESMFLLIFVYPFVSLYQFIRRKI